MSEVSRPYGQSVGLGNFSSIGHCKHVQGRLRCEHEFYSRTLMSARFYLAGREEKMRVIPVRLLQRNVYRR